MTEHYREQLETINQKPRENLLTFTDRYLQATRTAGLDPSQPGRTTHFMLRLPLEVRRQLKCFSLSAPQAVESVSAIVNTISMVYREPSTRPSLQGDHPSPWCPRHRTASHDSSECRPSQSSPSRSATRPSQEPKRWCEHHRSGGHDTKDCKAKQALISSKPSPASTTVSQPKCYRCNSPGHFADKCPRSSTQPRSAMANHHVSFNAQLPDLGSCEVEGSIDSALEIMNGHHVTLHMLTTDCLLANSPILAPILLANTIQMQAYVDTGASHSIVRKGLLKDLPDDIKTSFIPAPTNSTVSLGAKDTSTPRIGSVQVPFTWNGLAKTHRFELMDTPAEIDIIIGRDLLAPLGISIHGLPLPSAAKAEEAPDEQTDPTATDELPEHPLVNDRSLQDAINRNQAIPRNSFCNMPESTVFLHTGDASPVYRRQYGIAHSLAPIIDKQISEWFQDGKIKYAPRGCQWNHPLLMVPKKTANGSKLPGRVCIDPRGLNQLLTPEKFPIPRVRDIFDALTGRKVLLKS